MRVFLNANTTTIYLALGSNVGDLYLNLQTSIIKLQKIANLDDISKFYLTKPWGMTEQDDFLNAAVKMHTFLDPQKLLKGIKKIEREMGRVHIERWGPRIIDIDIIMYGNLIWESPNLTIPHKYMHQREFVLKPLMDIASDVLHPIYNLSIADLYKNLKVKEL